MSENKQPQDQAWYLRYSRQRPTTATVSVERTPVDATCPRCASKDVRRYPIANHLGPRMVVKCQACFEILSIDRPVAADQWPPFRSVTYDWEASLSESAGARR